MIKELLRKAGLYRSDVLVPMPSEDEPSPERRTQQRVLVNTPGLLHRVEEDGSPRHERVLLRDTSAEGFGILLPERLAIHQTEWLDVGGFTRLKTVVRYCRADHDHPGSG